MPLATIPSKETVTLGSIHKGCPQLGGGRGASNNADKSVHLEGGVKL